LFLDWWIGVRPCLVRGRCDPLGATLYFIVLDWAGNQLVSIRDFRYARYATEGAELVALS
jgi:RNA polymerase sigma-70 factor (ECF subfamily)